MSGPCLKRCGTHNRLNRYPNCPFPEHGPSSVSKLVSPCSSGLVDWLLNGSFLECSVGYLSKLSVEMVYASAPYQPTPCGSFCGTGWTAGLRGALAPAWFSKTHHRELLCVRLLLAKDLLRVQCGTPCIVAGSHLDTYISNLLLRFTPSLLSTRKATLLRAAPAPPPIENIFVENPSL